MPQQNRGPVLSKELERLRLRSGLSRMEVIRRAQLNTTYGYQIFSGVRAPSRDRIISLGLGLCLSLEELNHLLWCGGCHALYPFVRRDALVIFLSVTV